MKIKKQLYNQISKRGFVKIFPITCGVVVINIINDKANGFNVEMTDKGYLRVTV